MKPMLANAIAPFILALPVSAQGATYLRDASPSVRLILTPESSRLLSADNAVAHRDALLRKASSMRRVKADSGQSAHWFYYTVGGAAVGSIVGYYVDARRSVDLAPMSYSPGAR